MIFYKFMMKRKKNIVINRMRHLKNIRNSFTTVSVAPCSLSILNVRIHVNNSSTYCNQLLPRMFRHSNLCICTSKTNRPNVVTANIVCQQHSLIVCQYILQTLKAFDFFNINIILNCSGTNMINGKKHIKWAVLLCIKHKKDFVQLCSCCKITFPGNKIHTLQILFTQLFNFCYRSFNLFLQICVFFRGKRRFMCQNIFGIKRKYRNIKFNVGRFHFNGLIQCVQHNIFRFLCRLTHQDNFS